ncbi:MAG: hypothetical protein LBK76_03510 [Verrucomicrobiales bacterium]|jgi:hypothetical protein|nr:hypothetical protein [Verrucomicrobiales bacterium]
MKKTAWKLIVAEARKHGFLKFCKNGVAVLISPDGGEDEDEDTQSSEPVHGENRGKGRQRDGRAQEARLGADARTGDAALD